RYAQKNNDLRRICFPENEVGKHMGSTAMGLGSAARGEAPCRSIASRVRAAHKHIVTERRFPPPWTVGESTVQALGTVIGGVHENAFYNCGARYSRNCRYCPHDKYRFSPVRLFAQFIVPARNRR